MTFTFSRDLAKYRHNTRWWMRQHRTWPRIETPRPQWLERLTAKDLTGAL